MGGFSKLSSRADSPNYDEIESEKEGEDVEVAESNDDRTESEQKITEAEEMEKFVEILSKDSNRILFMLEKLR